jgi:hypothetical protein
MRAATNLLLALALTGSPSCTTAPALVPSGDPEVAPLPYTPEAIRDFNAPGTAITLEVRAGGDVSLLTFRWTGGNEAFAEYDQIVSDASGNLLARSAERTAWIELQQHGAYPLAATRITEETIEGPTGRWNCWHYRVQRDGGVEHYWFAKDKPGPPVRVRIEQGGEVVQSMELVALER